MSEKLQRGAASGAVILICAGLLLLALPWGMSNDAGVSPIHFSNRQIGFVLENCETAVKYAPETMAGGVAVLDFDNDGDLDVFFTNGADIVSLKKTSGRYWNRRRHALNLNPKITEYVAGAPDEQQPSLKWIRKLMRKKLEGVANERCEPGMVVYGLEKRWLTGFAWRKKCAMFYVMDSKLLDRYDERLGKLRSGKSCVEFRETAAMKMADLKSWAEEVMEEVRKQSWKAEEGSGSK